MMTDGTRQMRSERTEFMLAHDSLKRAEDNIPSLEGRGALAALR
jgi:hypothetical protein